MICARFNAQRVLDREGKVLNLRAESKHGTTVTKESREKKSLMNLSSLLRPRVRFASAASRYADKAFAMRVFSCAARQGNPQPEIVAVLSERLQFEKCARAWVRSDTAERFAHVRFGMKRLNESAHRCGFQRLFESPKKTKPGVSRALSNSSEQKNVTVLRL